MLQAIRSARRTITFETCIYWSGSIGREFVDALAERAKAGVRVLCAQFDASQRLVFEADWARGRVVTHAEWLARPWQGKVLERLAVVLRSQL